MSQTDKSQALFARAREVIPGGVNSPVRAFAAVDGDPPFMRRGAGAWIEDADGNRYLDLIGSWGPLILGHAHPEIIEEVVAVMRDGTSFGCPTEAEVLFAEELCAAHPVVEQVRLCSSGTEATMHAIRLARGTTGRDVVLKLDGCYHGAHDAMLVAAGSGVATFARPGSPGIPADVAALTRTAPYNDLAAVERILDEVDVACVILEAVPGNMGCIVPAEGYLDGLVAACRAHGTLLIVDEVMTGFRLARGGACERFGIDADLVCMGKIVGGGMPLAAFGGRREIMQKLSPVGPVYQAGTLSGNPVAVAAGRSTLRRLTPDIYARLDVIGERLEAGLAPVLAELSLSMNRVGSMFTIFFRAEPPTCFDDVKGCDMEAFGHFHRAALDRGVYLPPSQYEAVFLPAILTDAEVDTLLDALVGALRATVRGT